jgi:hypothetical protein
MKPFGILLRAPDMQEMVHLLMRDPALFAGLAYRIRLPIRTNMFHICG